MADVDPITLEVVNEGLTAIVREMRANIVRTSYSAAVYELDDFSCALFAPDGELVTQWNDLPSHVIPMPWGVRCCIEEFGDDIHAGDIILLNDPYRGGTHLNDVTVLYPVFNNGRLFIFPVVRTHWADVGGMTPGSYSGEVTSVFQEGVRIPPIKLFEKGVLNKAAEALILSNMRVPDERKGDLYSAIGTCRIAEERLHKLTAKYTPQVVLDCIRKNLARSEQRMRDRIRALPDGEYFYEDYLEYFEDGEFDPVLLRLRLIVKGDEIHADFAGSNQQVPGPVNSSLAVAGAGVFVALKATLDPKGAINGGVFRPITYSAPEGSIVNLRANAPAGAHAEVRKRSLSVMLGALSQVAPEVVSGDLCGTSFPVNMGGHDARKNREYVYIEVPAGGNGGFAESDGSSAFVNVDHGDIKSIQTAENLELDMPFLVESCELRTDSAGDGMRRGGLGMRRRLKLLGDEAQYSVLSDRAVIPPFGVLGGGSSTQVHASYLRDGNMHEFRYPGKASGIPIRERDTVILESAGGGGYGDPLRRPLEQVHDDVRSGFISLRKATDVYGVAFNDSGDVDEKRSAELRREIAASRPKIKIRAEEADSYEGRRGRHRVARLSSAVAQKHGWSDGTLIELLGVNPAPLRAWVRIEEGSDHSTLPLDAFGRRVIGVADGEAVHVRTLTTPKVRLASRR